MLGKDRCVSSNAFLPQMNNFLNPKKSPENELNNFGSSKTHRKYLKIGRALVSLKASYGKENKLPAEQPKTLCINLNK